MGTRRQTRARAYEDTNALFTRLNAHLIEQLEARGYRAAVSPEGHNLLTGRCS